MDVVAVVIGLAVLAALVAVSVVVGIRVRRQQRAASTDLRRAGRPSEDDPSEAARRAQGKAAWTRMSGGGG